MFCVALIPLMVKARALNFPGYLYEHFTDWNFYVDIFSWYKAGALILAGAFLLLCLLFDQISRGFSEHRMALLVKTPTFAFVAAFGSLVILSTISSEHTDLALWGFVGQFEGCLVWLSYLVLLLAASFFLIDPGLTQWVICIHSI